MVYGGARAVALVAAAGAAHLVGSAAGIETNGGSTVVRSGTDLDLTYEWEYVQNDADPYVLFNMSFEDVLLGASSNDVVGVSLGLASPDVTPDSGKRYLMMQSIRAVQIQIKESGGAVSGEITDLVKNFCSASNAECNNLGGWTTPRRRWQNQITDSAPDATYDCSVGDRMEVMAVQSSKTGNREDLTLQLKIFPDAFQGCANDNADAAKFLFDMTPNTDISLVYAVWSENARNTYAFNSPHTHNWQIEDAYQFALTKPSPQPTTSQPSMSPSRNPTHQPSDAPSDAPTTRPTSSPTSSRPTKSPTPQPTDKPSTSPTSRPTASPTSPQPSKAPTKRPTNDPTESPTMRPTKSPTTSRPSKSPTPEPTHQPSTSPTSRPTASPVGPMGCPNDEDYVVCSAVNGMYSHLVNNPALRMQKIKSTCNSDRFKDKCHYCASGAESFTACRPERSLDDTRVTNAQLCESAADPFVELGCKMFSECPDPTNMAACRAVNSLDIPGTNRNKRPVCINSFSVGDHTVPKGACTWCNGRCRVVEPYEFKIGRRAICDTPGLFGEIRECEVTPDINAEDISSPHL